MPALFALGQHRALVAAMHPSTKLMAFLDDVHVVTTPPRVADSYAHLDRALWEHAGIRINQGKTQIFNRAGVFPPGCQHILRAGRQLTPPVVVWRGDSAVPSDQQKVTILRTPLGHVDFVRAQLRAKIEEHRLLLDRVEAVPDLQCAWLILSFCGASRANYYLRTIHPSGSEEFAGTHDAAIMRVFFRLLDIRGDQDTLNLASLPCRLGSVGLQNAVRGAPAAYWSSWADSLHMIRDFITVALSRGEGGPHMEAAARCRGNLVELGFEAPEWGDLARGARPDFEPMANRIPASKHGWQQKASDVVENSFLAQSIWPTLAPPEQALLRSQQGPMAGLPYTCLPISPETTFQQQELRVLFLRRLWQPMPLSSFTCRCGRPLDSRGHHRAACPLAGVLGRRGFSLESAAARVCREAGGRVTTNVRVQDMDLLPSRRQPQVGSGG